MKLIVPYADEMDPADLNLLHLAEFCGVPWKGLPLDRGVVSPPEYLDKIVQEENSCFVVSPPVVKKWLSTEVFPPSLGSYLVSRFPFVLIHNLHPNPFADSLVCSLSGGCFESVHPIERSGLHYKISADSKNICGAFSGLVFGPVNPSIDRVLTKNPGAADIRPLISINDNPFFTSLPRDRAEVFFLATGNIIDLDAKINSLNITDYFSNLVPPIMLFRYIFREVCWHPNRHHATLIIDDPLLAKDYGFLNYRRVLELMDRFGFHVSLAFIPYNFKRTSPDTARVFRERPDRYSLCFHGNDHTGAEFGIRNLDHLNAMLQMALSRMDIHKLKTGIQYDRVMVFPQGVFSVNALTALKANNFSAAVNTVPHPYGEPLGLYVSDIIQPAIMRYGGFPLFIRKYIRDISLQDIAFSLFFGKPVLIVEHHTIFKEVEHITELVSRINSLAPQIHWTSLQAAIENSYLQRRTPDGISHLLAYSGCGRVKNGSYTPFRYSIVKRDFSPIALENVLVDNQPCLDITVEDAGIHFFFDLAPAMSSRFSIIYRNELGLGSPNPTRGFRSSFKVFLRRRLSEMRDNHLSKNPWLLSVTQSIYRQLIKSPNS